MGRLAYAARAALGAIGWPVALDLAPVPDGMGPEATEIAGTDATGDGDADEHDLLGVDGWMEWRRREGSNLQPSG